MDAQHIFPAAQNKSVRWEPKLSFTNSVSPPNLENHDVTIKLILNTKHTQTYHLASESKVMAKNVFC